MIGTTVGKTERSGTLNTGVWRANRSSGLTFVAVVQPADLVKATI
jgi:hypothetical protein